MGPKSQLLRLSRGFQKGVAMLLRGLGPGDLGAIRNGPWSLPDLGLVRPGFQAALRETEAVPGAAQSREGCHNPWGKKGARSGLFSSLSHFQFLCEYIL